MAMAEIIDLIENSLNSSEFLISLERDAAEYGDLDSVPTESEFSAVLVELVSAYKQLDDAVLNGGVIPEDSIYIVALGRWKSHYGLESEDFFDLPKEEEDLKNMAYGRYSWLEE